ncbi:coiled-coil domain-containing protein 84 isoform X2 [Boleophthalmus pectinirostris]|uniref:coiled-coil domain-containing protein 84 isoform X2 n=1 Tax=Boleophthalmus pectinirostris TaxID=150288 RepID=UPI002432F07E|nr:coiled-coil domain-containing protein 84 isoform X2 [Boleophthalmus pectinirostris]
MGAFYCSVCKQTTFSGKSHIFGKSHQSRLRVVLLKFLEKVKEAHRMLKKPQVETFDCTQHNQKFWCYCCELEVDRNVTDGNMTVLYAGLIEHMATQEHRKSTHKFWWENKADQKLKDKFFFSKEEIDRFKTEVEKVLGTFVEKEDEFIKQEAELIRNQEKHRQEFLKSLTEHNADQESSIEQHNGNYSTGDVARVPEGMTPRTGSSADYSVTDVPYSAAGLTFIGYQDSSSCGNVHTGALPPWLQDDDDDDDDDPLEGSSGSATQPEMGPSLQGFLKHKEQEKLKKLPPNRVGANFDHSSHTDANWLPSFGRVWNSGRRWQSRHQFRHEEGQKKKQKRKRDQSTD